MNFEPPTNVVLTIEPNKLDDFKILQVFKKSSGPQMRPQKLQTPPAELEEYPWLAVEMSSAGLRMSPGPAVLQLVISGAYLRHIQ